MFNGHRKVGEVGMSYQSPIEVIQTQMRNQIEGNIYQAVMNVGVNVDKEELLKALQYDREQYQKGYKDRDDQIVRCKDCKHATLTSDGKMCKYCAMDTDDFGDQRDVYHNAEWFCADGEKAVKRG